MSSVLHRLSPDRGLRGGEPCDGHAEWRARHIVEPYLMAESDRRRIAAMFPANADLEFGAPRATAFHPDAHELANALTVDRDEWVRRKNPVRHIGAEKARGVVAADAVRRLGQIIRAKGKEFGALGDLAGTQGGARQLDHRADLIADSGFALPLYRLCHGIDA